MLNISLNTKQEELRSARVSLEQATTQSKKYAVGTPQHDICLKNIKTKTLEIKRLTK